ncbi:TRAP transporter substrate-binding protein [Rhodoferax sp. PAMC 29310]|uniref:TRAP transporter substrate-binding protein n=1 Tax=Rhodoferax sp. PAMC 29310 TaxID=2822760 RepID=UPI001B331504|nr:TRAP transporter substrate-binding protein [Rhodoferax sp. PAMC 29310]
MPQFPLPHVHRLTPCLRQIMATLLALSLWGSAFAQDKEPSPYSLRIIGGLAGLNQYTKNEEPFWTKDLPRLSGGRFTADIVPFDRTGVPGKDILRLIQLGVIPFGTILLSSVAAYYPQFAAPDLAGLNPDMPTLKRNLAAFRPFLESELRSRYKIEMLAIYVYPAQVVYCKQPMTKLSDLSGRRVRVSSITQSDFMAALGATPVLTGFVQIKSSLIANQLDCAITGTMSGNTVGLHEVTSHIYAMPINWGLAFFGTNSDAWDGMPPDLRALLRNELPKLEQKIWAESERETADGLACNRGAPSCSKGRRGAMIEVRPSAQDDKKSLEILSTAVLPRWIKRCGVTCADIWNRTIGPLNNIVAASPP